MMTSYPPPEHRGGIVSLGEAFGRLTSTVTPIAMGLVVTWTTPRFEFSSAVRLTGVSAAVFAGAGSVICLLLLARSTRKMGK